MMKTAHAITIAAREILIPVVLIRIVNCALLYYLNILSMKRLSLKDLLESYESSEKGTHSTESAGIISLKDAIGMSLIGGYGTVNSACNNYNCDGGSNSGCTNNCCYNTTNTTCQPG